MKIHQESIYYIHELVSLCQHASIHIRAVSCVCVEAYNMTLHEIVLTATQLNG